MHKNEYCRIDSFSRSQTPAFRMYEFRLMPRGRLSRGTEPKALHRVLPGQPAFSYQSGKKNITLWRHGQKYEFHTMKDQFLYSLWSGADSVGICSLQLDQEEHNCLQSNISTALSFFFSIHRLIGLNTNTNTNTGCSCSCSCSPSICQSYWGE